jgi:ribosome-binding factor A
MKKRYNRIQRVGDLIQNTLAEILQREADSLQCGIITVTGVDVSQDMSHAKVFVSVLDEAKAVATIAILNDATKSLRYELAHAVKLRITPDLKFVYDDSAVRGSRISSLIEDALRHDKSHGDE